MSPLEKLGVAVIALLMVFVLFLFGGVAKLTWDCLYLGQSHSGNIRCS